MEEPHPWLNYRTFRSTSQSKTRANSHTLWSYIFPKTINRKKKMKKNEKIKKELEDLDNNIIHLQQRVLSHKNQQDRSKTGPTEELSISLRATWTSFEPCSQLIKLERRGKNRSKFFSNEFSPRLQMAWRVATIRGARAANSLRFPEPKGICQWACPTDDSDTCPDWAVPI